MLTLTPGRTTRSRCLRIYLSFAIACVCVLIDARAAFAIMLDEIGEWVVSCDNVATCAIVNGAPANQAWASTPSQFGMSRICISRRAGPDAEAEFFVTMRTLARRTLADAGEPLALRAVGTGTARPDIPLRHRGAGHWEVPRVEVSGLLSSLDEHGQLQVIAHDGAVLEQLAINGIGDALVRVDRRQERNGTVTALREWGLALAQSVPAEKLPQVLVTARLPGLDRAAAPSPEAMRLRRQMCGASGADAMAGYRLLGSQSRPDRILWVTPCPSAQGLHQAYFVIQNPDGTALPVSFPGVLPERPTGEAGLLARPHFDPETGRVQELWRKPQRFADGGHCAIQRLWGFDGQAFELVQEHRSLTCAGTVTGYWPRTFTRGMIPPAPPGAAASASAFNPPC